MVHIREDLLKWSAVSYHFRLACAHHHVLDLQYHMTGSYGPAIVLVHGFGAFWEHFRDNIKGLSQSGNRVWALTLLGFGRSEKPNVVYTELFWAELIRDFIVEVVGEAPIIVGNSIGGLFFVLCAH